MAEADARVRESGAAALAPDAVPVPDASTPPTPAHLAALGVTLTALAACGGGGGGGGGAPASPPAAAGAGPAFAAPGRALPRPGGDGLVQGQCRPGRGDRLRGLARRPVRDAARDRALGLAGPGRLCHRRDAEQPGRLRSGHVAPADRLARPAAPARRHGPARFPRRRHRRGQPALAPVRGRRLCRRAARRRVRQFPRPARRRSRPTSRWAIT